MPTTTYYDDDDAIFIPKSALIQQEPEVHKTLKLFRRIGHVRMELSMLNDSEGAQSAGNELDDAFTRAKKIWKFDKYELTKSDDMYAEYKVSFLRN